MNKLTLLFGVVLCLVAVSARHFGGQNDEPIENEEDTLRKSREHNGQARHRKRRWQMNYGYDYPPPSYHYPDRRDDRNNQDLLEHISKLLEEISAYVRRPPPPPPPPQPFYIPYPMFFNYPQIPSTPCNPQNGTGGQMPSPDKRINIKEMDPNQNWGLVVSNENDYDDGSDGSRPISFEPIVPKQFMKRPAPKVDHGSVQASASAPQVTTQAPRFQDETPALSARVPVPGMCNAAILSCCGMSNDKAQQSQCFGNIGCAGSFADGSACSSQSIQSALESFRIAYSPSK